MMWGIGRWDGGEKKVNFDFLRHQDIE